ncbi:ras and Rab interactor 1-like [Parambassis ranga]|uniref:Ras and Rab interactor 1-like n=1 Tax=Parambassis ranga TaxID=210632 RepID=A0A6P7JP26_9TELE|nr:ras and Rab interactor 1-like [Parambassis ranga]XP_028277246.1 ras and Rab interactor 1-like [Parambassis ranga]
MAQQEPLYDFPEPTQPSERKFLGHHRERGSLRSISVLDRLLLTVPVWLQLSINPATALHILQREPPGTFLVRKSRTSQRNVLCVRLADDSVPSFVQQFGIREESSNKTLSLETSAISFPDLPRLISFYCVSRDVLPFPLELPEAIAKATSHKELESISHMGIEFWSSHLNVRGPREALKPLKDEKKPEPALPTAPPQTSSPQLESDKKLNNTPVSDTATKQSDPNSTLFHTFCPITTRSPRELDCGSGQGALCFINPLFLQSQNTLARRRMFKRSVKVRVSTETSTLLSPPLAPPPPPPLMPKKGRCKAHTGGQRTVQPCEGPVQTSQSDPTTKDTQPQPLTQTQDSPSEAQVQLPSTTSHLQPEVEEQGQIKTGINKVGIEEEDMATAQLPTIMENPPNDSDYMAPCPVISLCHSPSLSPYQSPSVSPLAPPLLPKMSPSLSPHVSPAASPSLSPYQSPSLSSKVPLSLLPHDSTSPYQSPSPSPKAPFSLSPLTSPSFSQLEEQASNTLTAPEEAAAGVNEGGHQKRDEQEKDLVLHMNAASLNDTESCSSFSSLEEGTESTPQLPDKQSMVPVCNTSDCN